ncbi:MAG: DNA-binding protein [Thioalkalivibrio sp.]
MARLTYDDVVDAATTLLKEGRNPSATAVIDHLGHGSKSTALKHLQTWRETLEGTGFALPRGIPEGLMPAVERFWDEATQAAFAVTEFDRQAFAQAHEELRLTTEQVQRQRHQAEKEKTEALALAAQHERDRAHLQQRLEDAQERIQALETEKAQQSEHYQRELQHLRDVHAEATQEWQQERQNLKEKQEELETRIQDTYERYDKHEKRWLMEVAAARDHAKEVAGRFQADRDQLIQERRMAEQQMRNFAQERDQAQHKAMAAEEALERAQAEAKMLRQTLQQREQEVEEAKKQRLDAESDAQKQQDEQARRIDTLLQRLEQSSPVKPGHN